MDIMITSAPLGSSILNVRDMNTMITRAPPGSSVQNMRGLNTMITSTPRRVNMLILCLVMMLTIRKLLRMFKFILKFLVL